MLSYLPEQSKHVREQVRGTQNSEAGMTLPTGTSCTRRAELQMSCEETLQCMLTANEALVQLPDEAPRRKKRSVSGPGHADAAAAEQQPPMPAVPLDPSSANTAQSSNNGAAGSLEDADSTPGRADGSNGAVHQRDPAQEGLKAAKQKYEEVVSARSEAAGAEGDSGNGKGGARLGRSLSLKGGIGLTPNADAAVQHDAAVGPAASKLVEPAGKASLPCSTLATGYCYTKYIYNVFHLSTLIIYHRKQGVSSNVTGMCRGCGRGEPLECGAAGEACCR